MLESSTAVVFYPNECEILPFAAASDLCAHILKAFSLPGGYILNACIMLCFLLHEIVDLVSSSH